MSIASTWRCPLRNAIGLFLGVGLASLAVESPPQAQAALFSVPWDAARDIAAFRRDAAAAAAAAAASSTEKGRGDASPLSSLPPVKIIRRVENPYNWIAITFDACATQSQSNSFDEPLFEILRRERIPATVFTSGRWVEAHPDAMKRLVAEPQLELANHSYGHPHMKKLSALEIADELERTEEALGRYGRQSVAFRPPFGEFNGRVLEVARNKRIPSVLWDVVSGDPSAKVTAEGMTRSVLRQTRSGSIVIFHINGRAAQTATALPGILRQLRERGFQFVPLSKLLAAKSLENTGKVLAGAASRDGIMPLSEVSTEAATPVATPVALIPAHSAGTPAGLVPSVKANALRPETSPGSFVPPSMGGTSSPSASDASPR